MKSSRNGLTSTTSSAQPASPNAQTPSPNPSSSTSLSFQLTPSEIESLRQDAKEASAYCDKAYAHLKGTLAPKKTAK